MRKIGVLALQGGFAEHIAALEKLDVEAVPVRVSGELAGLAGLVIPGGESTTITRLMTEDSLAQAVKGRITGGLPVLGTCAGMVLLARKVSGSSQKTLNAIDIEVRRNAFGRQVDSFEADLEVPALGGGPFHAIFIRAPWIEKVGNGVEVLSRLPDGVPVAAREGNLVVTAFHPELTTDLRLHSYFLSIVDGKRKAKTA
ncbi:MAG: pyridoxal 5'-phosphate synthase glutaminase subunit PdxT [Dehalococcoidia bacterium]|nr:pyridoxal 5'-phosphate synthase glutaminase subunit PdxT [Dehalococcoidia bacterium]